MGITTTETTTTTSHLAPSLPTDSNSPTIPNLAKACFVSILLIYILLGFKLEQAKAAGKQLWMHESGPAILLGATLGFVTANFNSPDGDNGSLSLEISDQLFFNFVLPPIIFAQGYGLKKRNFFKFIHYITAFGILGTFLQFAFMTGSLFVLSNVWNVTLDSQDGEGKQLTLHEAMIISACLAAADEVAALSLIKSSEFPKLSAILFGEGVVNDAISILLFHSVNSARRNMEVVDESVVRDVVTDGGDDDDADDDDDNGGGSMADYDYRRYLQNSHEENAYMGNNARHGHSSSRSHSSSSRHSLHASTSPTPSALSDDDDISKTQTLHTTTTTIHGKSKRHHYHNHHPTLSAEPSDPIDIKLYDMTVETFKTLTMALLIGILSGLLISRLLKNNPAMKKSPVHQTAIITLGAYISFALSDALGYSGVLTVFFSGATMSHYAWHNLSVQAQYSTKVTFATIAQISEAYCFAAVGVSLHRFSDLSLISWKLVILALLTLFVGRAITIFGICGLGSFVYPLKFTMPPREQLVLYVGGLIRGAICWAQAIQVVSPHRNVMLSTTLFVILFTTLVIGCCLPVFLKCLKLNDEGGKGGESVWHLVTPLRKRESNGSLGSLTGLNGLNGLNGSGSGNGGGSEKDNDEDGWKIRNNDKRRGSDALFYDYGNENDGDDSANETQQHHQNISLHLLDNASILTNNSKYHSDNDNEHGHGYGHRHGHDDDNEHEHDGGSYDHEHEDEQDSTRSFFHNFDTLIMKSYFGGRDSSKKKVGAIEREERKSGGNNRYGSTMQQQQLQQRYSKGGYASIQSNGNGNGYGNGNGNKHYQATNNNNDNNWSTDTGRPISPILHKHNNTALLNKNKNNGNNYENNNNGNNENTSVFTALSTNTSLYHDTNDNDNDNDNDDGGGGDDGEVKKFVDNNRISYGSI